LIPLDRAPFRGARNALETLGQTGDRLERDALARLTVQVADLGHWSASPDGQPTEMSEVFCTGTAARFPAAYFVAPKGFWWRNARPTAVNVTTNPVGLLFTSSPPAVANGFSATRSSPSGVLSAVVITGGDTAATQAPSYVVVSIAPIVTDWHWVAPGITLAFVGSLVAANLEICIELATPLGG